MISAHGNCRVKRPPLAQLKEATRVSRLIAQIMLSILLFPLGALVYMLVFYVHKENSGYYYRPNRLETGMLLAGTITWAFVAAYWLNLWRKSVQWSGNRITLTLLSFPAAAVFGAVVAALTHMATNEHGLAVFIGSVSAPLLWQVGTILVWGETQAERDARLATRGVNELVCPTCGYNLSGLKGTRCPECGSEFTLDSLIASQPGKAQAQLET